MHFIYTRSPKINKENPSLGRIFFLLPFLFLFSGGEDPGEIPPRRAHHALVYDMANKCIRMTGGSTPVEGGRSFEFFNDNWCFNGQSWNRSNETGDKRSGIQLAYDTRRNKIFSFGGYSGDSSLSDLRMLENGSWTTISYLDGLPSAEPGFVYDSERDRLVVFGGSAGRGKVNSETWEWNGTAWIKFNGAGPAGRQAFVMTYDSKRKKTVLFGGMGETPEKIFSDTWEFDGKEWKQLAVSGPGPRMSPGFCYDSHRGQVLLFGGMTSTGMAGDTWAWDGVEWKKVATTGPAARAMGYMAYDQLLHRVVLFGGRLSWPNDVNDTWVWDGKEWKEIAN